MPMTQAELDLATRNITAAVIRCMPEAAEASGLCSIVDPSAWVAEISSRFPIEARDRNRLGLTNLTAWLAERGVTAGPGFLKALWKQWIKEELRRASAAGE